MFDVEQPKSGLEIHGPVTQYKLSVGGFRVPYLSGHIHDGTLRLTLDERFGLDVPEGIADQVVWFVANAIAIGAGYSCFGENGQIANPFKTRLSSVSVAPDVDIAGEADRSS